jgi:hypothetical protein
LSQNHFAAGCGAELSSLNGSGVGSSISVVGKHRTEFSDLSVYSESLLLESSDCGLDYFRREFLWHTVSVSHSVV